jgi:hypothetical protein
LINFAFLRFRISYLPLFCQKHLNI